MDFRRNIVKESNKKEKIKRERSDVMMFRKSVG